MRPLPGHWRLIARQKNKTVRDFSVIVLDRPRHKDLINEIRESGARVMLREEGDAEGALIAATADTSVDALMGIGGVSQGVLAACAVKASGGGCWLACARKMQLSVKISRGPG